MKFPFFTASNRWNHIDKLSSGWQRCEKCECFWEFLCSSPLITLSGVISSFFAWKILAAKFHALCFICSHHSVVVFDETRHTNERQDLLEIFRWEQGNKFSWIYRFSFVLVAVDLLLLFHRSPSLTVTHSAFVIRVIFFSLPRSTVATDFDIFHSVSPLLLSFVLFFLRSGLVSLLDPVVWWIFNLIYIRLFSSIADPAQPSTPYS